VGRPVGDLQRDGHFRDPWAFSEDCFLAASHTSLVLMDGKGRSEELLKLPAQDIAAKLECHEPRPLAPRPREPVIQSRAAPQANTGRFVLADVNHGRNMTGVKDGEIRKLLVLETLPMPVHFTGGMEPVSYGGTFTLERILGTVPVEPDGSACFDVPALRSVFFVALDENDMAVKRMQSFTSVQPGETMSCAGCHEHRPETPRAASHPVLALSNCAPRTLGSSASKLLTMLDGTHHGVQATVPQKKRAAGHCASMPPAHRCSPTKRIPGTTPFSPSLPPDTISSTATSDSTCPASCRAPTGSGK
jgi:hypothetical protein